MYRTIVMFTDLQDGGHKYEIGDIFPREGLEVEGKRIAELSSSKNKRGVALIEEIKEEHKETPKKKAKKK